MKTGKMFMYGSLMSGFFNYKDYLADRVIKIEEGQVKGTLYHLQNKGYPGFTPVGDTLVIGEIITFTDYETLLGQLDYLEFYNGIFGQDNMYNRTPMTVYNQSTGQTEILDVYIYNEKAFCNQNDIKVTIPSGSWRKYMAGVSLPQKLRETI